MHRIRVDDEVDIWLQQFRDTHGVRRRALTERCEIGVQLDGEFFQRTHRSEPQLYKRGTLHLIGPGEVYDATYTGSGRIVWFSIDTTAWGELALVSRREERCDELRELAELLFARRSANAALAREMQATLRNFLRRRAEPVEDAAVALARRELEQHFESELYLRNIADQVGLRPVTLLRRFALQYGTTPIQYRIKRRLNYADRLFALEPDLSVAAVAARAGFDNLSYFHRQFTSYIGCTPGRRRAVLRE